MVNKKGCHISASWKLLFIHLLFSDRKVGEIITLDFYGWKSGKHVFSTQNHENVAFFGQKKMTPLKLVIFEHQKRGLFDIIHFKSWCFKLQESIIVLLG